MILHTDKLLYLENSDILGWMSQNTIYTANKRNGKNWKMIKDPRHAGRVLVKYESLTDAHKEKLQNWLRKKNNCKHDHSAKCECGNPYEYMAKQPIRDLVERDFKAEQFYAGYRITDDRNLPIDVQRKYTTAAEWLNMLANAKDNWKPIIKEQLKLSRDSFWQHVSAIIKTDDIDLPTSYKRLTEKITEYKLPSGGYAYLISDKWSNQNARKIFDKTEQLFISLYIRHDGRTNQLEVQRDFNAFVKGEIELVDFKTGEVLQPSDFDANMTISVASVNRYVNMEANRKLIDAYKLGKLDYQQKWSSHNRRTQAVMAMSMATMDDYQAPFKTMDGKRSIWMYIIFDTASKAIIGISYRAIKAGEDGKDQGLVNDALKDMMQTCLKNGWGLPMELEMERHLNYSRRGSAEAADIFTEGNVFKFIRFAKGGNSQEKYAERLLGAFKYEQLVHEEGYLGRPFARNEDYKGKKDGVEYRYEKKELLAKVKAYVDAYNNSPHPTKPELTRWQYLEQHQNPEAVKHAPQMLMPYIGIRTETSVRRGDCVVKNAHYKCTVADNSNASGGVIDVEAYFLPDNDGTIPTVYLFQKGKYIGEGTLIERYSNARAERTEADYELLGKQTGRQLKQQSELKELMNETLQVGTIAPFVPAEPVKVVNEYDKQLLMEEEDENEDWAATVMNNNNQNRKFSI